MARLDLYPLKGTYQPGEAISLEAGVESEGTSEGELRLSVYHLANVVKTISFPVRLEGGPQTLPLSFSLSSSASGGYGVEAVLSEDAGVVNAATSTAFDVQRTWLDFPRYGFLSDFSLEREGASALNWMARFHINSLQFYDWQYRHDQLLPPDERYDDPLGRALSLTTVRNLIAEAHEHGVAAMAYLAVYAASLPFAEAHPTWRLFDEQGRACHFEDFLGLMNPEPGSPWVEHLLGECERTLAELPFDGLHVDQYGNPKVGYSAVGESVDIPGAFQAFIEAAKRRFPESAVTLNAVGNWPVDALAPSSQDFVYIELWQETPSYRDVFHIVRDGRWKSGGKPVVIAQYIPAEQAANIRLSDALIFSLGGSRIELGERGRLLSDPYFPKHQALPEDLERHLRRYYDFAVRYGELIGPAAETLETGDIALPEGVLPVLRRRSGWIALHLINFTGLEGARWCEPHTAPEALRHVPVSLPAVWDPRAVWYASPDHEDIGLTPLEFRRGGERIELTIPCLAYWAMLAFEIDAEEDSLHD